MRLTTLYDDRHSEWLPWTRYWSDWGRESDETIRTIGSQEGYLWRPDDTVPPLGGFQRLRTLEAAASISWVMLLNDAGAGKSATLATYAATVARDIAGSHDVLVAFEARELHTRMDVEARFLTDEAIRRWVSGDGTLHLLIDGLDEARFGAENVADALASAMEAWPVERLRLRITIQSTVYRRVITTALRTALATASARSMTVPTAGQQPVEPPDVRILHLQGLQRMDAYSLAVRRLQSEERARAFLEAVDSARAETFAALPLTLHALLSQFKTTGALRARVPELFKSLCTALCRPRRFETETPAGLVRTTSEAEWIDTAAGLCAALVFSQSKGLWLASAHAPSGFLTLEPFLGTDVYPFGPFQPSRQDLHDVASSALFTGDPQAGDSAVVVTKPVYAEFLAARWMIRANLSQAQVLQMLGGGDSRALPILPHLRSVATWAASMSVDIATAIIRVDPEATVWDARADLPDVVRPRIADALLARAHDNTLREPPYGFWRSLSRLSHPTLADQLTAVVTDGARHTDAHVFALRIAQSSEVTALEALAAQIALTESAARDVRVEAARTVAMVGRAASQRQLQALACAEDANEDEQLRGAALQAAWRTPPPRRLFAALRPRRRDSFYGSYAAAMGEIAENLDLSYARAALEWLHAWQVGLPEVHRHLHDAAVLVILQRAADSPPIRRRFAELVVLRAQHYQSVWTDKQSAATRTGIAAVESNGAFRRAVLLALIDALAATAPTEHNGQWPSWAHAAFDAVRAPWTLDDVSAAIRVVLRKPLGAAPSRAALAFIRGIIDWTTLEHITLLWPYRQDALFLDLFAYVPTGCGTPGEAIAELRHRRSEHEQQYSRKRAVRPHPPFEIATYSRVATDRDRSAALRDAIRAGERTSGRGAEDTWVIVADLLLREDAGTGTHGRIALAQAAGLHRSRRAEVAAAAYRYLEHRPALSFVGFGNGTVPRAAELGCLALLVLA